MVDAEGTEEVPIGKHLFRFEPPDIFHIAFVGDVSGPEMAQIAENMRRLPRGTFFVLANARAVGAFSNGAKKNIRDVPLSAGVSVFGASATTRVVLSLLNKVYMMVYLGADSPIAFHDGEEPARAWIEGRRREIAARKAR
jgi:hypothetical protein